jgi:hypothetical protein
MILTRIEVESARTLPSETFATISANGRGSSGSGRGGVAGVAAGGRAGEAAEEARRRAVGSA